MLPTRAIIQQQEIIPRIIIRGSSSSNLSSVRLSVASSFCHNKNTRGLIVSRLASHLSSRVNYSDRRTILPTELSNVIQSRGSPPKWLKDLELLQDTVDRSCSSESWEANHQVGQKDGADEIIIYQAKMKDDFSGSPNRIGLSMIGLLITTGLVANQIRHHGAGPVWSSPQSDWMDFELKLWEPSTRILISVGAITFSFLRSLKFLFTLSHTIKRITIKSSDLNQMRKLIAIKNKSASSKDGLLESIDAKLYSIGSLDLVYPIRKLFRFSIFGPLKLNHLIRFSQHGPASSQPSIWLKFLLGEQSRPDSNDRSTAELKNNPLDNPILLNRSLNSLALQIPRLGTWGNSKYSLNGADVQSLFEHQITSFNELTQQNDTLDDEGTREIKKNILMYKEFGLDLRQSISFNFIVLKSYVYYLFYFFNRPPSTSSIKK